jgi:hypothetical protein
MQHEDFSLGAIRVDNAGRKHLQGAFSGRLLLLAALRQQQQLV